MDKKITYFTLPNLFTLMNLVSGSFAVFYAFELSPEKLYIASIFIFISVIFDFLDGLIARLTKSVSEIGKNLDSLADLISFGVAPAVIIFQMLKAGMEIKVFTTDLPYTDILILLSPILLVVAGALRLAKFNVDDRQKNKFLGLAIPASAIFFASLPLLDVYDPYDLIILKDWFDAVPFKFVLAIIGLQVYILTNFWLYVISVLFFSVMQLIELPMFSLKFDGLSFKKNIARYIFLILAILLFALFQSFAIPFIIIIYILFSVGDDIVNAIINNKHLDLHDETFIKEKKSIAGERIRKIDISTDLKSHVNVPKVLPRIKVIFKAEEGNKKTELPDGIVLPDKFSPVTLKLYENLNLIFIKDIGISYTAIQKKELEDNPQITIEALHETSIAELVKETKNKIKLHGENDDVVMVTAGANHVAALVIIDDFWRKIHNIFKSNLIVAIPSNDTIFIAKESNPNAKERLLNVVNDLFSSSNSQGLLSKNLYFVKEGETKLTLL